MKSYKLNKTLENSTYPIEQELKNLNRSTKQSTLKTIISVSTVLFSGIATNFIYDNHLLSCKIYFFIQKYNLNISVSQIFLIALVSIYSVCIIVNIGIYICGLCKEQPQYMKKNKYGRRKLAEDFHKSIINDIVVGLSFVDKSDEELKDNEVKKMYLYEATYYFSQASNQIIQMKLFDDKNEKYNDKLVNTIGRETLLTTLMVFRDGVHKVMDNICEKNIVECIELEEIYTHLKTHINILTTMHQKS